MPGNSKLSDRVQAMADAKKAQILGVIDDPALLTPGPQAQETIFGSDFDITEPPPPWELEDTNIALSDARRYVEVPDNWVLRWINPRLLEQTGWGYWKPVLASDPRVTVRVESMVAPDGNVRRGGFQTGDVLSWVWRTWYDGMRQQMKARIDKQTESAVRRQDELRDQFRRGEYGPFIHLEDAKHPTHTMGEGRSMRD